MTAQSASKLAVKIAVFTKNRVNPAYGAARLGAERTAARLGARIAHYVPDVPDDPVEQSALLERAVVERPDAIALAAVHPTHVNAAILKVNAAGIPLVGFISRSTEGLWESFVGSNDCELGFKLASYLFARMSGTGDVVLVEASPDSSTSVGRARGFRDAAARHPGIRIVGSCHGAYQFEAARAETARLLGRTPRVDAVLAANDVMALGAIAALQAAGRRALVVGVNAIPEAIDAIKRGTMLATADFNAMNLGALAVECAVRRAQGEAVPREILLPAEIVDSGNVAAWDRPYEERSCVEWTEALRTGVKFK